MPAFFLFSTIFNHSDRSAEIFSRLFVSKLLTLLNKYSIMIVTIIILKERVVTMFVIDYINACRSNGSIGSYISLGVFALI